MSFVSEAFLPVLESFFFNRSSVESEVPEEANPEIHRDSE